MKKVLKALGLFFLLFLPFYLAAWAIWGIDENNTIQAPDIAVFAWVIVAATGTWLIMRDKKAKRRKSVPGIVKIIVTVVGFFAIIFGGIIASVYIFPGAETPFWYMAATFGAAFLFLTVAVAKAVIGWVHNKRLKTKVDKIMGYDKKPLSSDELVQMYPKAVQLTREFGRPSETYLQHKLDISFSDARILTTRMKAEGLFTSESVVEPVIPQQQDPPALDTDISIEEKEEFRPPQKHLSQLEEELYKIDHMNGTDFEVWCAELLNKSGYNDVSRTGKAGDQGVDILAEKDGITYAIQCKCYSRDLGNTPIQEVSTGKQMYQKHIGAVMTNRYFTKGAVDAAKATGTLLWDRDWLIEKINASSPPELSKPLVSVASTPRKESTAVFAAPVVSTNGLSGPNIQAVSKPEQQSLFTDDYMARILMDEHRWRNKQRKENAEAQQ